MDALLDKTISLKIPESMVAKHQELHEELYEATQAPSQIGEAARRVDADAVDA
ncbi:MAG: hypothetical protein GX616_22880 [Planctomycetes bacterium]|nr:hypothetical protein [Planctomycetota bacterium]